jgi:ABC-type oligopeptide transport system ATPase subunit
MIGILGGEGAGKTTAARYLADKYGGNVYALAAPLKEIVGKAFDLTGDQLYGTQEQKNAIDPRYNVSPRWLFRHVGTEGIRGVFGDDVWVKLTVNTIRQDGFFLSIIDDVRFANEAEYLMNNNFKIIKLVNTSKQRVIGHQSETEWDFAPYNVLIQHDGKDINLLHNLLDTAMGDFGWVG